MWKSGEKSIQFWGKIRKKFIEMWKWAQKKVATLLSGVQSLRDCQETQVLLGQRGRE